MPDYNKFLAVGIVSLSEPAKRIFSITIDNLLPEGQSEILSSVVDKVLFDGEEELTAEEHVLLDSLLDHTLQTCEIAVREFQRMRGVQPGSEGDAV